MPVSKADILARLQKEILPLQGYKPTGLNIAMNNGIEMITQSFPNKTFPLGAIHEFVTDSFESNAATGGFIAGLFSPVLRKGGTAVWISEKRTIFPPALQHFGIAPDRIIFMETKSQRDLLWAVEETLKCNALCVVIAEIAEVNFIASRRMQLAVEQSQVTGCLIRCKPRQLNTIASVSRWKVHAIPGDISDELPGVSFPRWNVSLLKVRNGKPGSWQVEWEADNFKIIERTEMTVPVQHKIAG